MPVASTWRARGKSVATMGRCVAIASLGTPEANWHGASWDGDTTAAWQMGAAERSDSWRAPSSSTTCDMPED